LAKKNIKDLYLFKKNELKEYYHGWNILKYEEYVTPKEKHGKEGVWHYHHIASILAKKSLEI
jgi:hypothetical protein